MGSIGPAPPPAIAWTTISDETPESSANWLSYKLTEQAVARQTTPGTLSYTPASDTMPQNVAPWNSWISPNCPLPGLGPTPVTAPPAPVSPFAGVQPFTRVLFLGLGILGGLASAKYLASGNGRRSF